jgi:ATP-dependent exoDNAse (exonuclease V) alpha subunit
MPSTSKKSAKRAVKRKPRAKSAAPRKASKGLRCPDCDFVAAHAMGLGRHRSSRHGVVSQRQRRRETSGGWVTRREAARRAGVHYNTVRHWERTGRLRRSKRAGSQGAMVSATDLDRLMGRGRAAGSAASAVDTQRIQALERRFNDLLSGLERLVSSARGPGRGRRAGSARG